eukprot:GFYU01012920.1.p1 GENE.GFYU01012920.1~~GFYU01012920.1.p1  ORF type:complete len:880 (+),score=290.09 GFYU01012920.1:87-2726(+)
MDARYTDHLHRVRSNLMSTLRTVPNDELIQTLRADPVSAQYIEGRVAELIEDTLRKDREAYLKGLATELATKDAEAVFWKNQASTDRQTTAPNASKGISSTKGSNQVSVPLASQTSLKSSDRDGIATIRQLKMELIDKDAAIASNEKITKDLKKKHDQHTAALKKKLKKLQGEYESLEEEISKSEKLRIQAQESLVKVGAKVENYEKENKESMVHIISKYKKLKRSYQKLVNDIHDKDEEIKSLNDRMTEYKTSNDECHQLKQQHSSLKNQVNLLEHSLQDMETQYSRELQRYKDINAQMKGGFDQQLEEERRLYHCQLKEVKDQYDRQLRAVEHEINLQHQQQQTTANLELQSAMESLKKSSASQEQSLVQRLEQTNENMTRIKLLYEDEKRKRVELEDKLRTSTQTLDKCRSDYCTVTGQYNSLSTDFKKLQSALQKAQSEVATLQDSAEQSREDGLKVQAAETRAQEEIQELNNTLSAVRASNAALQESRAALNESYDQSQAYLMKEKDTVAGLRQTIVKISQVTKAQTVKFKKVLVVLKASVEEEVEASRSEYMHLVENLTKQFEGREKNILVDAERENAAVRAVMDAMAAELKETRGQMLEQEKSLDLLKEHHTKTKTELMQALDKTRSTRDDVVHRLEMKEVELHKKNKDTETMGTTLQEKDVQIAELKDTIRTHEAALNALGKKCQEQELQLHTTKETLSKDKDQTVNKLINQQEDRRKEFVQKVQHKDKEIANLHSLLSRSFSNAALNADRLKQTSSLVSETTKLSQELEKSRLSDRSTLSVKSNKSLSRMTPGGSSANSTIISGLGASIGASTATSSGSHVADGRVAESSTSAGMRLSGGKATDETNKENVLPLVIPTAEETAMESSTRD